jgi:hypothetical protein
LIELDFELGLALDKVGSPVLPNWVLVTLSKQQISYIFDSSKPERQTCQQSVQSVCNPWLELNCKKQAEKSE